MIKITLSLLPPIYISLIEKEKFYQVIKKCLVIFLIALISISLVLFFAKKILERNFRVLTAQNIKIIPRIAPFNKKIQEINNTLKVVKKIQTKTKGPILFLLEFSKITPRSVKITSLQLDLENNSAKIRGQAQKRSDLLKFKDNLETSAKFTGLKIPLDTLLLKEKIDFEISLSLVE